MRDRSHAGIRRVGIGKSFCYFWPDGRIRSLAIPPTWTDVWVCPHKEGHIQAGGRDATEGYSCLPWRRRGRDETEFDRRAVFGKVLPGSAAA
jgi:DNA topoisomerase-1